MRLPLLALIGAMIALQAGCVTGRRQLSLPVQSHDIAAATQGSAYIVAVTDDREFQNKPSDPSIPSIDGDVTKLSVTEKDRMIGRQRNTWGKAMGDIGLAADDSVTKRARLLVEQGIQRKGYQISSDPNTPNKVTVSVKDFWAWMTPGIFALTFEAKIACLVTVDNGIDGHSAIVKGYALNHGQFAKDANWQEAYDPAFEDFIANFDAKWNELVPSQGNRDGVEKPKDTSSGDIYPQLKHLEELRKNGILTDQEFDAQKKKVLGR